MLYGRWGKTTGRPFVEAFVRFPRLNAGGSISFYIDTGADSSMIMPADAQRIGFKYNLVTSMTKVSGLNGEVACFLEDGIIAVAESSLYIYQVPLRVAPLKPHTEKLPSLLGRDILDNWTLVLDKPNNSIEARIVKYDHVAPLEQAPVVFGPAAPMGSRPE